MTAAAAVAAPPSGLQTHHLRQFNGEGGLTDIDEMIAGCTTCHHLAHDDGWRFEGDPAGEIRFCDPDGVVRARTHPHRRHRKRRRPPRSWISDPPPQAGDNDADPPPADGRPGPGDGEPACPSGGRTGDPGCPEGFCPTDGDAEAQPGTSRDTLW